jgi:hypothetical protein
MRDQDYFRQTNTGAAASNPRLIGGGDCQAYILNGEDHD